jgi:hypothetical protein
MSYFAKVEDGVVTDVIAADQDYIDNHTDGTWVQTSYNTRGGKHYDPETGKEDSGTPLRKNYAGLGYIYDSVRDVFYAPQPYPSWTLDEDTCYWEPPVAYPDEDDKFYKWDEDTTAWVEVEKIPE